MADRRRVVAASELPSSAPVDATCSLFSPAPLPLRTDPMLCRVCHATPCRAASSLPETIAVDAELPLFSLAPVQTRSIDHVPPLLQFERESTPSPPWPNPRSCLSLLRLFATEARHQAINDELPPTTLSRAPDTQRPRPGLFKSRPALFPRLRPPPLSLTPPFSLGHLFVVEPQQCTPPSPSAPAKCTVGTSIDDSSRAVSLR